MADYSKKTNADLVEILKSRSLPHTGKKADLVARLQQDDEQKASGPAAATSTVAEDVIDWDDEPTEPPIQPATEAGANAIAAGGKGEVANPVAVPNQKLDTDPATTDDLKVESTEAAGAAAAAAAATEAAAATATETKAPVDFTSGLPASELEAELAKRKKRAEKFGIQEDAETALKEAEKSLQRAKRFGNEQAGAATGAGALKGLDEPLPSEPTRKRGRNEQGGRGGKRRDMGRNRHGRGHGKQNRNGGGNGVSKPQSNGLTAQQKNWSEKDVAALEARKKRFAVA
ncbi:hypothetical protein N7468_006905 [Penicillium chermesinum]|uniref:SAP domain-containing protein n=1 Tax=Penicillium chermesinum TaxID=63820 RepID=A0A9W9TLN7_9EURO|nr:uncharacterized protein N7468_006905 [Penicillium chermesinum]KAJ5225680.1 hypothetical protein N7468_006905 [Penicillium chermesinum]KAJ6161101.1 hypothetical protein N7470_004497 [Penicillium chermesinum]